MITIHTIAEGFHGDLDRLRTSRILQVVLLATILTAAARPADARWHLDIQAGAFSPISDIEFNDGLADIDIDLDTGGAFAVSGGYAFERWIDLTARAQSATHFDLYDESVNSYSLTVGGRFFPLPMRSRVRPWIGLEMGYYYVDANIDDFEIFADFDDDIHADDNSFGLNTGAGVDFLVNHRVSLGVDVRYNNAFTAFEGVEFVTTMFNVTIWFGDDDSQTVSADSDTPPVPRSY